jgi:plastocyanin
VLPGVFAGCNGIITNGADGGAFTADSSEEVLMNLHRVLPAIVIGLVAAAALAGCGSIRNAYGSPSKSSGGSAVAPMKSMSASPSAGGAAVTPATGSTVAIQNFAFAPQTLTVKVGTKVTWTNSDTTPHTVTSVNGLSTSASLTGLFDSGPLAQGQSFSFTFSKAGTYFYECTIHAAMASMHATVVVK